MIRYSKHFKDIGLTKEDVGMLPRKLCIKRCYRLNRKTKIAEVETWNLNYTLALVVYAYLKEFEQYTTYGTPMGMKEETWLRDYKRMLDGFAMRVSKDEAAWLEGKDLAKWNEAKKLLAKYWDALWW